MLGKNPLPISLFTYYSSKIKLVPFQKKLASHNSMQKKDDKVGNKTVYKRERQRRKTERVKKIKIDSQKKHFTLAKFCLMHMHENQKGCLILCILGENFVFFWHQSEARTAATVWNWSGKTLSPGALLSVLYFSSFHIYFSARLDFPSTPLSAPGSPRMDFVA